MFGCCWLVVVYLIPASDKQQQQEESVISGSLAAREFAFARASSGASQQQQQVAVVSGQKVFVLTSKQSLFLVRVHFVRVQCVLDEKSARTHREQRHKNLEQSAVSAHI